MKNCDKNEFNIVLTQKQEKKDAIDKLTGYKLEGTYEIEVTEYED